MAGSLLLGIDIGTYSAKGVVCTPEGEVVASHVIEHDISLPRPGWVEQDADAIWWNGFVGLCKALIGGKVRAEDIGGVAVSAIGPCLLPVDEAGAPLRPGILYGIDTRASDEIEWLEAEFRSEDLLELGGMGLTSQAIGPKILWLRRNEPEVYAKTHKILTASSYLIHKLTGEYVIDRHTGAHFNPLVNIDGVNWDDRFAGPIVEMEKLPAFMWSTEIAGTVTAAAAAETGLAEGTPVTAGTVDAAAESISVGVVDPGDMMVMYGTTMFLLLVTDRPVPDERVWATGYVLPNSYDTAGGMSTTGALTRWFRDEFGATEMLAERVGGPNAYSALGDAAAKIPPGAEGLICLPYFAGERTPINDPDARGVIAGLTLSHSRAHVYRALLESTGYGVRHILETMEQIGAPPKRLVAVGGGARNRAWLQMVTDISGREQIVPDTTVGASYGDAFLAGLATGIVPSLDALAGSWVKPKAVIAPDPAAQHAYNPYYRVFRSLYEHARDDLHALARLGSGA